MTARRICTFTADGVRLGFEIEHVLEIVRADVDTPVPLAPTGVVGLLNLRGRIVTVVDARTRLDLRPGDAGSTHVVVRNADEAVSFLVDREGDILDVDAPLLVELPATAGDTLRSLATSAYLVDGETVVVLDPSLTLSVAST